jgi:toxin YoeB
MKTQFALKTTHRFDGDIQFWSDKDPRLIERILALMKSIADNPFLGIGKPEPLKNSGGRWSRRINDEHRLIYRASKDVITFISCRGHYDDR